MDTLAVFPVSLHLRGKCCLVVGGDAMAETRVRALLACEAMVRLVSPQVTPWLAALAQQGVIQWERGSVQPAHLSAVAVVFVTTQDPQIGAQIAALARQQPCLVHITDNPAQSDFALPAVVRRGPLTLAISTAGQAPAFAAWLRKQLERLLDHRLGQVVEVYAGLRPSMKQRYPDLPTRAQAWAELLTAHPPPLFTAANTELDACEASHHPQAQALTGRPLSPLPLGDQTPVSPYASS